MRWWWWWGVGGCNGEKDWTGKPKEKKGGGGRKRWDSAPVYPPRPLPTLVRTQSRVQLQDGGREGGDSFGKLTKLLSLLVDGSFFFPSTPRSSPQSSSSSFKIPVIRCLRSFAVLPTRGFGGAGKSNTMNRHQHRLGDTNITSFS